MQYHVAAVRRGAPQAHVIGDLPYNSYRGLPTALENALLLIDAGADSVKLEGPAYDVIAHLVANGVEVIGHTGLTPQTPPDFKQAGRTEFDAQRILQEAIGIAEAGAFMVVLEHIPADLAESITRSLRVPTIGIGAGASCDGQVLVVNDAIGLGDYWPPFSRQYAYVDRTIVDVAASFVREVREGTFVNNLLRLKAPSKQ
jgi:3-methyl-2-oxobutanoate hydroxymethyltransferase